MTIQEFMTEHGITVTYMHAGLQTELEKNREGKKEPHTMDAWQAVLTREGNSMTSSYRTGLGYRNANRLKIRQLWGSAPTKAEMARLKQNAMMSKGGDEWLAKYCDPVTPKPEDLLNALAMDASCYEGARNFEDFCSELGYDDDSRTAERVYKACGETAKELKYFLGAEAYEVLLYEVERL